MIKVTIHNLKSFETFLSVACKFVQQGQLVITKEKCSLYCKNLKDFSSARLLLDTNLLTINTDQSLDIIKVCLRDISAFRSSIDIINLVENKNQAELELEEQQEENEYFAKTINYNGKAKFKLITIDLQVIEQYISTELKQQISIKDWEFNIDPARLDIIQNRTNNIVNVQDDVSVYLYGKDNQVMVDLTAKKSNYINRIALPISEQYIGKLPDDLSEVAIHESSFRILNILRVTNQEDLKCFFTSEFNLFMVESQLNMEQNYWIKSRLLIGIIKGK